MSETRTFNEEKDAVFKELSVYSGSDQRYTTILDNYAKLETIDLTREKWNFDYERQLKEIALKEKEIFSNKEIQMLKIEAEKESRKLDFLKSVLSVFISGSISIGTIYLIMNYEETKVFPMKFLNVLPKIKI